MEDNEDEPEDVRKATPVSEEIESGRKDEKKEDGKTGRTIKDEKKPSRCDKEKQKAPTKSEADCCRSRIAKPTKDPKTMPVVVLPPPCSLPKLEIIPRHCLSRQEYIDVLATPSRKCGTQCVGRTVIRKARAISTRVNELAQPARRLVIGTLQERGGSLPPEMISNLVKSIEGSTCMSPEQAEQYFRDKERGKEKKSSNSKKQKKCCNKTKSRNLCPSNLDKEAVTCQYMMAERFVRSILQWKCPIPVEEFKDISSVILRRLSFVLEYTPTDGQEDVKSQQMKFLADIIACWISGVLFEVAEDHRKEIEEQRIDGDVDEEEEEEEDEEDEENEEEEHVKEPEEEEEEEEEVVEEKLEEKPVTIKSEPKDVLDDKAAKELEEAKEKEREREEAEKKKREEEKEAVENAIKEAEKTKKELEDELARLKSEIEELEKRKKESEAEEEERRAKREAEEKKRLEEEEEYRKKKEAEQKKRLEEEEENRKKKEAEEKKRLEEEEENRKKKEAEEKKRLEEEEENRKKKEAEELQRKEREAEEERLKQEAAEKKRLEDEAAEEKRKKEEAELKKKKAELDKLKEVGLQKAIEPIAEGELFKTDVPFTTFGKIFDTIYTMLEDEPEGDETDVIHNRIQRSIYEKLTSVISQEDPESLNENLKDVVDVLAGKAATWVKNLLTDSEIKFMADNPPEVESMEIRNWSKWIDQVTDRAEDWAGWIHRVVKEAENKNGKNINRGDWNNWTSDMETKALLWRRYYLETVHQAHHNKMMMADRNVVKTGNKNINFNYGAEEEIKNTELEA